MANQNNFREPNNKEFLILKSELDNIKALLKFINNKLLNKDIVIKTHTKKIIFKIESRNVLHLLGLSYKGGHKALWFDYKKNRISLGNVGVKRDGTTIQKLRALHSFEDLFTKECILTGEGRYESLTFDASLRTSKLLLAIGLKYVDEEQVYYPNTTLNLKSKIMPQGERVIKIYTIDKNKHRYHFSKEAV